MAISVKEMSNFSNSCKETQIFSNFWSRERKNLVSFCLENAIHGTIDVEISLAKGIIFTKLGLANGAILKLLAAHPYPKFSQEPPLWLFYVHLVMILIIMGMRCKYACFLSGNF